jgi:carbon starvation protein CstA
MIAFVLTQMDFGMIWRYFAWSNQTLAMVVLWTITAFLIYEGKAYWISGIPALFMTMVCSTYILIAPEGFNLENDVAYFGGSFITICITVLFSMYVIKRKKHKLSS